MVFVSAKGVVNCRGSTLVSAIASLGFSSSICVVSREVCYRLLSRVVIQIQIQSLESCLLAIMEE